ncbi:Fc.00g103710.m01.CDS01 [Cosmosporella sp. VM-42]
MKDLINRFLSGSSQGQASPTPGSQVFTISASSKDPSLRVLHPAGYPKDAPPLYSVSNLRHLTPNMVLSRGIPDHSNAVAFANFHLSSPTDLTVHGQHIPMKMSQMSGSFTINYPPIGKLKWKPNPLTGSSFELFDSAGLKLAKLGSAGFPNLGDKKLQIFVACDGFLQELIILSALTAKDLTSTVNEAAGEVASAIAGV